MQLTMPAMCHAAVLVVCRLCCFAAFADLPFQSLLCHVYVQAEHNSRRQYLAHTKLQDKATLAQSRRHTDAVQREEFMQWCEFDHCSKSFQLSGSVVEMADTDSALKVLGINQNANLKDIR